jgi:anthranilate phosphoribosyltransferase
MIALMQGQLCMLQEQSSIKQGVMMAEDAIHSGLALEKWLHYVILVVLFSYASA